MNISDNWFGMNSEPQATPKKAGSSEKSRVSVAEYSSEEVLGQFLALYNGMDFKRELDDLGITRFSASRRKRIQREFQGLSIALWRLALLKSFPDDAERFFTEFKEKSPIMNTRDCSGEEMQLRVSAYMELMEAKRDKDFLPVAGYLANILALDEEEVDRLRVKLSLIIRNLFTRIFNKLV